MISESESFATVQDMLRALRPTRPVYCTYPDVYEENAREFVKDFPGRVLYAVKANDHPDVIDLISKGGVQHFDCASLAEIETVMRVCNDARCYFMTPVRLRGAAQQAQSRFGVRHFLIDHLSGIEPLAAEIDMKSSVVFVRMATSHPSALQDLSARFGALEHRIGGLEKEDVTGNVSYDPLNHEKMVRLRAEKVQRVAQDYPPTEVNGEDSGSLLILGWGSTKGAIKGALRRLRSDGMKVSHVHLRHLNPLPRDLGEILGRFEKVLIPEMNLGQLAFLVRGRYLVDAISYSKVQGQPFRTSEIAARVRQLIG